VTDIRDSYNEFFAELGFGKDVILTQKFKDGLKSAYYAGYYAGRARGIEIRHEAIFTNLPTSISAPTPTWEVPDAASDISRSLSILVKAQLKEGTAPDRIMLVKSFGDISIKVLEPQEQCDIVKRCPYCGTRMAFQGYEDGYYSVYDHTAIFMCPHCYAYENIVRHPPNKEQDGS